MNRPDLLALTADALMRLSNVGLVKRAQKELASGVVPTLVEDADGTVTATARDGASTRLARGVALQQTTCTCGSTQVCRHRLAAVLAYQQQHAASAPADQGPDPAWDPGTITDDALLRCCGEQLVARARATLARGLVATTRPGTRNAEGQPIAPSVLLPTATVQFLVPGDVAYAKCDCAKGQACEHIVLAVHAFRAGPGGGVFTLAATGTVPTVEAAGPTPAHTAVIEALAHLVRFGLTAPGSVPKLVHARAAAERERWWWIVDGLESVERLAEAYQRQSARFRLPLLAQEVGELVARVRASLAPTSPLPARWILGSDTAAETPMEQVRLLSLGARLDADDDRRMVRLYFADPDTATVLVLDKTWPDETRNGHDLGSLFAASRMSIADLARGELITRAARRRANGAIDLGAARGMKSSVLPSTGSWASLPEPLLVRDLAAHAARLRSLPPRCLSPRGLGVGVVVVQLGTARELDVSGDGQAVTANVEDTAGNRLVLTTHYRQVSPGAVDATADALRAGATHVAGHLHRGPDGWWMEPLALMTRALVVVDLHRPTKPTTARATPDAGPSPAPTAVDRLAASLQDYVGRTVLKGDKATAAAATRLAHEAEHLSADQLARLCTRAAGGEHEAILDLAVLHQLDPA
ncbi:MAG: SWIM zinc finger family protein [Kofleriaceae bacterium]|nr:SWIM zinc finger family protein [Kofleriaceae bacterium]